MDVLTPLDVALRYIARGWNPLPVPFRSKRPEGSAWQTRVIDATNAAEHFNGAAGNVGVLLGPSSHGLTDVDLDCAEAIAIAPYVLPKTGAIFGRASKRFSHRLYYTDLAVTVEKSTQQFTDPRTKQMLVELRIGGGDKGAQTVFPGSTHEDGEAIAWEEDGNPADAGDLDKRVRTLAAFTLLARGWPQIAGGRHDTARVVGGFLARTGTSPGEAKVAVEAIARAAGDEEWRDRRRAAEDAATACHNGGKAYGFPALSEAFGKEVASKVAEWLGFEAQATPKQESAAEPPSEDNTVALHSIAASSVEMRAITWLWINRFAIGAFGIIAGLPDEGKGQVVACMTAQVTNGGEWPMKEGRAPQGSVIVFSAEENINDTLVPRLAAAGADLNRVHIIQLAKDKNGERMFNLMTDLSALRQKIIEIGDVKLVTIDPVGAYLGVGKVDSFRGNDVRGVLMPLKTLAEEMKVAIVGVMHFNKKIDVTNALLRISDSLAFGAVARHVYGVIDDAENERRLFVRAKNNAAARSKDKTLAYRFNARMVGTDATTSKEIWAPYVEWEPDYVDVTASEAMTATNENKSPGARNEAKEFLLEYLADGPMSSKAVEDAAEAHGIAKRILMRARKELGINITKRGFGEQGEWTWKLHPKPDLDAGF